MFTPEKIRPLFTGVITTAITYVGDVRTPAGLIDVTKKDGDLNLYQYVYAVGNTVTGIKAGDIVHVNLKRYLKTKHLPGVIEDNIQKDNMVASYEIPMVNIAGKDYLYLQNNDIDYVVEEWSGIDEGGLLQ